MSTFNGRMKEYSFVSLDRFDGDNLRSKQFYLSHCHQDHMIGLCAKEFENKLRQNNYKIYTHSVTVKLLMADRMYRHLKPFLVGLEVEIAYPFSVDTDNSVEEFVVTLLPAGHCPGSVMFLFEGKNGTVLYTGDIRIEGTDLPTMNGLHIEGRPKPIRSLYFDSTFCLKRTVTIPTRKESTKNLISLCNEWLDYYPKNKVLLSCAAKYGQEYLFIQLSLHFNMKVHVPDTKYVLYSQIPDLAMHVTKCAAETRIHACSYWERETDTCYYEKSKNSKACPDCQEFDPLVRIIKPSMLYFSNARSNMSKKALIDEKLVYRIQYSSHSSLVEIRDLIKYLNPEFAYPNVAPAKKIKDIFETIKDLLPAQKTPTKDFRKSNSGASETLLTLESRKSAMKRSFIREDCCVESSLNIKHSKSEISPLQISAQKNTESNWDLFSNIDLSPSSSFTSSDNED